MKIVLLTAMFLIAYSCKNDLHIEQKNKESDKRDAEKVMDTYFDNVLLDKERDNLLLYSNEFFKVSSKEKMIEENELIKNKLGKVLGKELKHWETSVVSGTSPKSEYLFIYNIQREKYNSTETFYLVKESTDSIKIYSYKIESEGLLKSE